MAYITQVRGALLEEAVLFLLRKVGYATVDVGSLIASPREGLQKGKSGLEVRGRGTWHQIDGLAQWTHSPAFMYPLYLLVEAKCYRSDRPIQVEVIRNAVGVLKDISENYFTERRGNRQFGAPRYNYAATVASVSGFTQGAVEYAVAHQVFLLQYDSVPAIEPLIQVIEQFDERCVTTLSKEVISGARKRFRLLLGGDFYPEDAAAEDEAPVLTDLGESILQQAATQATEQIRGSYFGMLQGRWPLHLLRSEPLPAEAFTSDLVRCEVHGNNRGEWRFVPVEFHHADPRWFELQFSLPAALADLVAENWEDPIAVANIKQAMFSYIDLTGIIGGVRRSVRLQLDRNWIHRYTQQVRRRRGET